MRLFIGIQPGPDFLDALKKLQDDLRSAGVSGRWLAPSNLHMTLAFIGEWPDEAAVPLPEVEAPFSIRLSHPGIFDRAAVLWAGVRPSNELNGLAASVRAGLDKAGIPYDPQAFYPHITLARKPQIPEDTDIINVDVPEAEMVVDRVCLYRSEREESGMVYSVIRAGRKGAGA